MEGDAVMRVLTVVFVFVKSWVLAGLRERARDLKYLGPALSGCTVPCPPPSQLLPLEKAVLAGWAQGTPWPGTLTPGPPSFPGLLRAFSGAEPWKRWPLSSACCSQGTGHAVPLVPIVIGSFFLGRVVQWPPPVPCLIETMPLPWGLRGFQCE